MNPGWREGAERGEFTRANAGNRARGSHSLVTCRTCLLQSQGGCPSTGFLSLGTFRSSPLTCALGRPQIMHSRAHHHARTTTRTRTDDKPTRHITLKGKETSKAEGNPEQQGEGRGCPLALRRPVAFRLKARQLSRISLFLFPSCSSWSQLSLCNSNTTIEPAEGWGKSSPTLP